MDLSDFLFEVGALDIFEHDRITDDDRRRFQVTHLLKAVKEDKNDCFHWFQFFFKKENNKPIIELLRSASETASDGMNFMDIIAFNILRNTKRYSFYEN